MNTNPFYRNNPKRRYIPEHSGRLGQGRWIDVPDPFGRLPEPSKEEQLDISNPFVLSGPVRGSGKNNRTDVGKVEALLRLAGVFDVDATDGPTGYYGTRLKEAISSFQKNRGLKVDGAVNPGGETLKALGQTLQDMGRKGDTVLAHLSTEEAEFLHTITDGGSINPHTGLMEFWNGDHESEAGYGFGSANDAQTAENNAQGNAFGSANRGDPAGYGDLRPVNAVNRARAQAQTAARDRQAREHAAEQARRAGQARIARKREEEAKLRDLKHRREEEQEKQQRLERLHILAAAQNNKPKGVSSLLEENDDDFDSLSDLRAWRAADDQAAVNENEKRKEAENFYDDAILRQARSKKPPSIPQQVRNIKQLNKKIEKKRKDIQSTLPATVKDKSLLDQLIDSLNEFMNDPNKGPVETPPLDPPMGPPPPTVQIGKGRSLPLSPQGVTSKGMRSGVKAPGLVGAALAVLQALEMLAEQEKDNISGNSGSSKSGPNRGR